MWGWMAGGRAYARAHERTHTQKYACARPLPSTGCGLHALQRDDGAARGGAGAADKGQEWEGRGVAHRGPEAAHAAQRDHHDAAAQAGGGAGGRAGALACMCVCVCVHVHVRVRVCVHVRVCACMRGRTRVQRGPLVLGAARGLSEGRSSGSKALRHTSHWIP